MDNHVVCEAWSDEYSKQIMVDPSYGLYLMEINRNVTNSHFSKCADKIEMQEEKCLPPKKLKIDLEGASAESELFEYELY